MNINNSDVVGHGITSENIQLHNIQVSHIKLVAQFLVTLGNWHKYHKTKKSHMARFLLPPLTDKGQLMDSCLSPWVWKIVTSSNSHQ